MNNLQEEYEAKKCWGMVASVDCYNCEPSYLNNPEKIKQFIVELCEHINMVRHGEPLIERFAEGALEGYSALQFIETSSVTMHFDEGENRAFIDIFSCKYFEPDDARQFCQDFLKASNSKEIHYLRV